MINVHFQQTARLINLQNTNINVNNLHSQFKYTLLVEEKTYFKVTFTSILKFQHCDIEY